MSTAALDKVTARVRLFFWRRTRAVLLAVATDIDGAFWLELRRGVLAVCRAHTPQEARRGLVALAGAIDRHVKALSDADD